MKKASKIISGLDIQSEYMSVAQYSHDENAVLLVAIQPVSLTGGADIGEQLSDDIKELKTNFKFSSPDIVCSIPSECAIIKRLPVEIDEENPDEVLEWELSQQVIGSIDEYVFDFQEIGLRNDNAKDYLTVAYRKDIIDGIVAKFKGVKLNPYIVDLDIFALVNVFEANYRDRIANPALIIHGENDKTKLVLTANGNFIDHECFDYANGSLEVRSYIERLRNETDRFLGLNSSAIENSSVNLFLTGALFGQPGYSDGVIATFGNGELLNPFRKIGCRVGVDEEKMQSYMTQLAVAVGLAYRGND